MSRFRFIAAEKAQHPVALLCRVLQVARSGFYAWLGRQPSARARADAALTEQIQNALWPRFDGFPPPHASRLGAGGLQCHPATTDARVGASMCKKKFRTGSSLAFSNRCHRAGITISMGSVGDCYDNAMAESFFATLECELIARSRWRTHGEARMAIFDYIEGFYNPRRWHSALAYLSPAEDEKRHEHPTAYFGKIPWSHRLGLGR